MNPNILGVIGPGFLNQVPTLNLKLWVEANVYKVLDVKDTEFCSPDVEERRFTEA